MSSHSRVAKKLSAMALSKASPTDPIEGTTLALRHRRPKSMDVYWQPRSLWWMTPFLGRRLWMAMLSASTTSSARRFSPMRQPMTLRL